ncbi:DUF3455 domain-containing protein [Actinoplanes sp. NPDC051861]|uniref:DUF3455 domain-containing protein n=1 Tax=Actinoplanes sp. NPDC051861 TaxID=3155170 RepID=UPI003449375C
MLRSRLSISAGFAAVAVAAVAVPAGISFAGTAEQSAAGKPATTQEESFLGGKPTVPAELAPPAGNVVDSVFKARGVQIYGCQNAVWTLIEPAATLTGVRLSPVKKVTALHFRGPSWQSDQDGSLLEGDGASAVRAPSSTPNSIPQLRITAKLTRGDGVFGKVTYIQRLDTKGGIAPAGACSGTATTAVPYTAVYRFFVAKA